MTLGVDYYAVLGVVPAASTSVVHAAYRTLALAYHPQKAHEDPQRTRTLFHRIGEAYDVLKDGCLRALYDQLGILPCGSWCNWLPGWGEKFTSLFFTSSGHEGLTTKFNAIPGHPYGYRYHGKPLRTFEDHFGTTHPYADVSAKGKRNTAWKMLEKITYKWCPLDHASKYPCPVPSRPQGSTLRPTRKYILPGPKRFKTVHNFFSRNLSIKWPNWPFQTVFKQKNPEENEKLH